MSSFILMCNISLSDATVSDAGAASQINEEHEAQVTARRILGLI